MENRQGPDHWNILFALLLSLFLPAGLSAQTTVTLGGGSYTNSNFDYPAPYGNYYEGAKHQILVRASELSSAGLSAGDITELGLEVSDPTGNALQGFSILIGHTGQSSFFLGMSFLSGLDTALYPTTYTPSTGWNMHTLDDPFVWDGSSNIVIETCFNNTNWDENDEMVHTDMGWDASSYYRNDAPDVCSNPGNPTPSNYRPNLKLTFLQNIPPDADFKADHTLSCDGAVQFSDLSDNNPSSWKWYFGDGDSSSAQNPSHTYSSSGLYTVTLIVSNANGSDTLEIVDYIEVDLSISTPVPASCTPSTQNNSPGFGIHNVSFNTLDYDSEDAETEGYQDFTCYQTEVYEGQEYTLSAITDTPTTHNVKAWIDFNNDGVLDDNNEVVLDQESVLYPSKDFMIPTTAVVDTPLRMRVMADYDLGTPPLTPCTDPEYGQAEDYAVRILENPFPPVAELSVSDTLSCDGTVQFTDASQNAPTSWKWYFGDGDSSNAQNPTHTYSSSGTYTVQLIVFKNGNSDTVTYNDLVTVDLSGQVKAASCTPQTLSYCCDYGIYEVELANIHKFSGDASEGYQDFSCGSHTQLVEGGNYSIDVKTSSVNKQDTRAWIDYDSSGTFESSELVMESLNSYNASGSFQVPIDTVKNVRLRMRVVSDFAGSDPGPCDDPQNGQAEDYSVTITDNNVPPTADFEVDSTFSCDGVVQFQDLSSNFPTNWQWDFGDGNGSTAQNPTHVYSSSGTYTVSLTASNGGGSDTETKTDYITVDLDAPCDTFFMPLDSSRVVEDCKGVLLDDGGFSDYSPNSSGVFTIAPPSAKSITLDFQEFHFEYGFDSLRIFDGASTASPRIGSYTGSALPEGGSISSSGGTITIQQFSDGVIEESGFHLEWECTLYLNTEDPVEDRPSAPSIHPNPSSEAFFIEWEREGRGPDRFHIFNLKGGLMKTVLVKGRQKIRVTVSDWADGPYLIGWKDDQGIMRTERLIVQD